VSAALPTVWQATSQAYRDTGRALSELKPLAIAVFPAFVAAGFAQDALLPETGAHFGMTLLVTFLVTTAQQFVATPYLIAVHRLIILDEHTKSYALDAYRVRFQRFFLMTIAPYVAMDLALILIAKLAIFRLPVAVFAFLFIVTFAACAFVVLRLTIIYPAIAVDASGASLQNAFADTSGQAWRIFGIMVLTVMPILVPGVLAIILLDSDGRTGLSAMGLFNALLLGLAVLITQTLFVVIASRLYILLSDRTRGADVGTTPIPYA
jgi:hypothetical protein